MKRTTPIAVLAAALLIGMTIVAAVNSSVLPDRVTQTSTGWYENTTQIPGTSAHLETIQQNDNSSAADDLDVQQYIRILQSNKSAKIYARPFGNDTDYENIALQYVSETYGIPVDELIVSNKVQRHFRMLDWKVWKMKVMMRKWNLKQGPVTIYEVFINPDDSITGADEVDELEAQDKKAHKEKYGKLEPELYDRLQSMQPNETLRVIIDVKGIDSKGIEKEVLSKYPNIEIINYSDPLVREKYPDLSIAKYPNLFFGFGRTKVLIKDGPLDRTEIERIRQEIRAAKKETYALKETPLIDYLNEKGYDARGSSGSTSVDATLPKEEIITLQERDDIIMIWRGDIIYKTQINTAVPTIRANEVWSERFDGTGVKIAIVEPAGVDFSNPHLHGCMRPGQTDVGSHATRCAGVAASDNPTFQGVAYGATILSANADSAHPYDIQEAADWAIAEGAEVLSCSVGNDTGLKMDWLDRYFDKVVYEDRRSVVIPSGNSYGNVTSPGLGWNVITVGGIDDGNNADWSDDDIDPQSGYIDLPETDRNKPEVCAVSMPIRSTETEDYFNENGIWITEPPWLYTGTSYAAPAVAGEIALLTQWFIAPPEMFKAVVMASAIHNAYGDKIDDKEGMGTVDVSEGYKILYGYREPHVGMFTIPSAHSHFIYFDAVEGENVRFVVCWCSHTNWDVDESYDVLESDVELYILDPQNNLVGISDSDDNGYEVVDFKAQMTGEYLAQIFCGGEDEDVGCAWSRIALTAVAKSGHRYNNVAAKFDCPAHLDGSISYGDNIIEYKWNFGDGEIGYGKTVEHGYETYSWVGDETGHYVPFTTSLTVKDDEGDADTDTIYVNVYIAGDANGDGVVDILDVACVGKHYGQTANPAPANCTYYWDYVQQDEADLNNDGRVSTIDPMIVGTNWNHLAYPPYIKD